MEIVNSFASWLISKRMTQIEHFMRNPHRVQSSIFKELIRQGAETVWGKKYKYHEIRGVEEYRARVPISTYEDFFPYILRLLKGEQNLLWPTQVSWFSKSSGTTNAKSKFIPITKSSLEDCHYKAGKDMLAIYIDRNPETKIFKGKSLGIGGSLEKNVHNPSVYCGDVSAILMKKLPFWAELMRTPSLEIALMDEWESKIERMAQKTINENVTSLAGVPTWTLILLQKVLNLSGKKNISEVWPNLEMFAHGGVAFGPYRDVFKSLICSTQMHYVEIYNASEGFFGIQDSDTPDEMLLMLDYGVFYEFIPMSEWGKETPKVVGLEDVEIGKNYALVISTNAGLWRYLIGDTIRFTSTSPYRIKISGRTKHFINAFGEEVIIENAEQALVVACEYTQAQVSNFTAAPIYLEKGKRGGHEWLIEFEKDPTCLNDFTYQLDRTLQEINSDYQAKRYKDIALVRPKVHSVPQGTFYHWMKQRGKLGGQHKVPRLANSRKYLDEILAMVGGKKGENKYAEKI